ncbi:hypothetical protein LTR23_010472 [Exophiala sp. CCFEE 6169]|nr:hypothetical protein LTR23_010472 [Chaetothyriales sp. CCFEE 6169]
MDLSVKDHSIEASAECAMAYINHAPRSVANAHFAYCETARGRVIRVFAKKTILRPNEITIFYGLIPDVDAPNPGDKAVQYRGLILQPGNVVFVHNGKEADWPALVEDISLSSDAKRRQYRLHVQWLERNPKGCARRLRDTGFRDIVDIETVNKVANVRTHTGALLKLVLAPLAYPFRIYSRAKVAPTKFAIRQSLFDGAMTGASLQEEIYPCWQRLSRGKAVML